MLVAHRGDPAHAPENTLASFESARSHGAHAVEMDVRRCSDGAWVVYHDRFSRRPPHAPSLIQALSLCRSRRLALFIDVKESDHERELLALLRRSGWLHKTTVFSSTLVSLRRWRRLLPPRHRLFWVTGYRMPLTSRRVALARAASATGIAAYRRWITQLSVRRVHAADLKLFVWTARTGTQLRRLARLRVDGIMSEVWPPPRSI